MAKQITFIVHPPKGAGPLEYCPPLTIGGVKYALCYGKPLTYPDEVVAALQDGDRAIEIISTEDEPESPTADSGTGDGAASEAGGSVGGADSAPDPLDRDNDGAPGGSLPADPPSLSGKKKAELLEIASAEGVVLSTSLTVKEITDAILAGRNG